MDAGRKWAAAQPLYSYTRGFVYSPLVAAFFALFSWLPVSLGSVLWRLLTAAIFIWAIFWWLKAEINRPDPEVILLAGVSADSPALARQF